MVIEIEWFRFAYVSPTNGIETQINYACGGGSDSDNELAEPNDACQPKIGFFRPWTMARGRCVHAEASNCSHVLNTLSVLQ